MAPKYAGPIPGANMTADRKSLPWHRPPLFSDVNKALDHASKNLTQWKTANSVLTIVELGIPLYKIAGLIVMAGVMKGKWTVDIGIMMVGPLTKIIELMCIGFNVKYELGIDEDDEDFLTGDYFKGLNDLNSLSNNPFQTIAPSDSSKAIKQTDIDEETGEPVDTGEEQTTEEPQDQSKDLGSGFMM